jgi:hypothetical protein
MRDEPRPLEPDIDANARCTELVDRPVLADALDLFRRFELYLDVVDDSEGSGWIDATALANPSSVELQTLQRRFKAHGVAPNRKAGSASLLLRFGWVAGFPIATYLTQGRVPIIRDYSILFSPGMLLEKLWVRSVRFIGLENDPFAGGHEWDEAVTPEVLRQRLRESLLALTEPVLAAQHAWSGFSRQALWAMATSSWAEQFANVGRQCGNELSGVREAEVIFSASPELKRAAPALYQVEIDKYTRTCQRRRACCLYFKGSSRYFCANCPIIPESDRLQRNRRWIADHAGNADVPPIELQNWVGAAG